MSLQYLIFYGPNDYIHRGRGFMINPLEVSSVTAAADRRHSIIQTKSGIDFTCGESVEEVTRKLNEAIKSE